MHMSLTYIHTHTQTYLPSAGSQELEENISRLMNDEEKISVGEFLCVHVRLLMGKLALS